MFANQLMLPVLYGRLALRSTLMQAGLAHLQVYHGMGDAARSIVQRQGVQGLYAGLGVTLLEIMPYAALQFGLYDLFTKAYERRKVPSVCDRPHDCCRLHSCVKAQLQLRAKARIAVCW